LSFCQLLAFEVFGFAVYCACARNHREGCGTEIALNWVSITDFGDTAVMIPVALALAAWMFASRDPRSALAWLSLFGAGGLLVLSSQIAYAGWGIGVRQFDFTGVSGHSMAATSVFTVVGYFIGSRFSAMAAFLGGVLGYCAGILVGISRVLLGDHSPSEVVVGCMLGGAIALATIAILRTRPRIASAAAFFAFTFFALVFGLHGHRAPSHRLAVDVALYLSGRSAPFTRAAH